VFRRAAFLRIPITAVCGLLMLTSVVGCGPKQKPLCDPQDADAKTTDACGAFQECLDSTNPFTGKKSTLNECRAREAQVRQASKDATESLKEATGGTKPATPTTQK
jgi:hypothetical protein